MEQLIISVIFFIVLMLAAGIVLYFTLKIKRSQRVKQRYNAPQQSPDPDRPPFREEGRSLRSTEIPTPRAAPDLRRRLAGSWGIGKALVSLLSGDRLEPEDWDGIEEILLGADVGVDATEGIIEGLRQKVKVGSRRNAEEVREMLVAELTALLGPDVRRDLNLEDRDSGPAVVMMVGVNGSGKTTTAAKIARVLVSRECKVVFGAADTFRAAAAEQLKTWGDRIGVPTVTSEVEGSDPAAVAYKAVRQGIDTCSDVVIVDTAGRLQNKVGLMDELAKIRRVIEKQTQLNEVLLVIDATTGQNGLNQAKVFKEAVNITGIILTKLDGTAKGGIVVAIQKELGVPVKLVGLGEGPDDLVEFKPKDFAQALVAG